MRRLLVVGALSLVVIVAGGAAADTFAVTLVSQTNSTITLGWTPQPGYGYLFSLNGQLVSRTNDPNRSTVKFSKGTSYDIDVIVKGANGHYPPAAPSPQCSDGLDNDGDGKIDLADPGCTGPTDNDETNVVPPAAQCADGLDNDADGKIDYPADPGCSSATDTDETDLPSPTSYPDASSTGVPSGVSLTSRGSITVTTDGQVIDASRVSGGIVVRASNVIIKNSLVTGVGLYGIDVDSGSATVQDVEINCGGAGRKGIFVNHGARVDVIRADINHCEDGVYASGNFSLRDSFIHDQAASSTAHNDGIQTDGQLLNVTVEHNTIYAIDTSAIAFCNNTSCPSMTNILIKNNLLAGGAWTLYCPKVATTNFQVVGNHFSTIFWPKVGFFGSNTDCTGETGYGNIIHETGAPVSINT